MGEFHYVRQATVEDVPHCEQIARVCERKWNGSLGWVRRATLADAVTNGKLHVAVLANEVIGFVQYTSPGRGGNVGWNVIHALAVQPDVQAQGVGRALLYSVPTPLRLLCPAVVNGEEPNPAQVFYRNAGLFEAGESRTKNGKLLRKWELRILPILVQGNNKRIPEIARRSGWAYGTRAGENPQDYPIQVDIEWRNYVWSEYLEKIRAWRPVAALVADYEHPEQHDMMLQQVQDLRDNNVLRILVCPKFAGAVADIPDDCIVAVSIPSSYSGFLPDPTELSGRRVHLLGGSPTQWFGNNKLPVGYINLFESVGAQVISVDGNAHTKAAAWGGLWGGTRWVFNSNKLAVLDLYALMVQNGIAIATSLRAIQYARQLPLF